MIDWLGVGMYILRFALMLFIVLQVLPLLIWMERKVSSYIQDRRGPAYANIGPIRLYGLVHTLTDVFKLIGKEDITPKAAYKPFHYLAPALAMFLALLTFAVIPYAATLEIGERSFPMQVAQLPIGILYVLAISSLGVYAMILAAWSSNNKYSMFAGLRSSSQMVSYELVLTVTVVGILLVYGSLELRDIVESQGWSPWTWGIILQPLAAILFIVCAFAETNRAPFDLPEGESEIVGFHVEYSSLRFALFFMAEYAHVILASALIVTLFFGGYEIPFVPLELIREHAALTAKILLIGTAAGATLLGCLFAYFFMQGDERGGKYDWDAGLVSILVGFGPGLTAAALLLIFGLDFELGATGASILTTALSFGIFMAKLLFFCFCFIWVRWTLPRFRYDQLMRLGWKYMLPLALVNVLLTAWIFG